MDEERPEKPGESAENTERHERGSRIYKQGFVYDYLKDSIITGRLAPEKQLVEREICDQLGVSRTPVREAFRRLSSEGLVDFLPGSGVVVASLTKEKAEQLYELKQALEGMAARLCARRATDEELSAMSDCIARHRSAYEEGVQEAAVDMDARFHELLIAGAHSPMLEQHTRELLLQARRLSQLAVYDADETPNFISQHEDILRAVKLHDPDRAQSAVVRHIEYVKQFQWRRWAMLF